MDAGGGHRAVRALVVDVLRPAHGHPRPGRPRGSDRVKERKGPFGQMVGGIVDSVVQTARRRAQDREPRALVYDAAGRPRLLKQGEPGRDALVEAGARLIELVGAPVAADGAAEDAGDEVV